MINYWAVLVAAIISMVVGSIWYGPLFGKKFMQEMGMNKLSKEEQDKMKANMMWSYVGQLVASLVSFYVLAWFINATGGMTAGAGMHIGFLVWLGFTVPIRFGSAIWGGKMSLFWIGIGSELITLIAVGALIGAWR